MQTCCKLASASGLKLMLPFQPAGQVAYGRIDAPCS